MSTEFDRMQELPVNINDTISLPANVEIKMLELAQEDFEATKVLWPVDRRDDSLFQSILYEYRSSAARVITALGIGVKVHVNPYDLIPEPDEVQF